MNLVPQYAGLFEIMGYVLAPLFAHVVDWTLENAAYPVKVALRDGEPVFRAARKLYDTRLEKYRPLADWREVYLTRSLMKDENGELRAKYFEQNGLDRPFTMLDTGYAGSIWEKCKNLGIECQPLFICSANHGIKGFLNEYNAFRILDGLRQAEDASLKYYIYRSVFRLNQNFCQNVLEEIPHVQKHIEEFSIGPDGLVVPVLVREKPITASMHKGFYRGFDRCFAEGNAFPPVEEYIRFLLSASFEMDSILGLAEGYCISDENLSKNSCNAMKVFGGFIRLGR
ncbi:MAG: hypothetical protein LBI17_00015 [Rickettsiales bacterium]|jgi:hypothetical protein|nr:hypothetical protein [Rickettsiales bacterium]